ncbi:unnamed protein product [Nezara viridula]|uniref:SH3 domain-containing protein n=1 Tax=Nezara viridula TaxID=85310 RepID=A0A9P0MSY3_NEZVI|nr:unnamed protein product [Nezara viridula]
MRNGLKWLMGIRPSSLSKPKVSLTWVLKTDQAKQRVDSPVKCEPSVPRGVRDDSWAGETRRCRKGHRRSRTPKHQRFGYQITDLDAFLTKASIETPGNIPVVLSTPCLLYQTQAGGYQEEVSLPLGMVVNAVFKNQAWLYVQTPHGEEGYVRYASCLPLGILPPESSAPWESQSDIFPKPTGNRIEEKIGTRSECGSRSGQRYKRRGCGEESVDSLYLAAQAKAKRQVLIVVAADYIGKGRNTLSVNKGDVVTLISSHLRDWFWVRTRDGKEGFIPAVVAGHGFL